MPVKVLGKSSVASALSSVMFVMHVFVWVAFVFITVFLGVFVILDAFDIKLQGYEIYRTVSFTQYLFAFASLFVFISGLIILIGQLRNILQTLAEGDPFVPDNAKRLRRISYTIAAMLVLRYIIGYIGSFFMPPIENGFAEIIVHLIAWSAALTLWVLSHVFAEGARLREEEKMTI